jgi:hypothetical protein
VLYVFLPYSLPYAARLNYIHAQGLLQSAREENAKLGFATAAGPGSALESAVKIMNAQ